jgi:putative transposase
MVDRKDSLPVTRQCALLDLPRSTFYHVPKPVSDEELALMALIDRCHLKHPFYGSRRIRDWLEDQGYQVNRKKVQRLMRTMDLAAQYPKRNLSLANQAHKVYPYLLRDLVIDRPNQVWATEIVFTQMTKTDVFAARVSWDDIANFDLGIGHDNPVDQKFNQLTLLFEGGIDQPPLNAGAELLDGDGQSGDFLVAFGLGRELGLLFRQCLVTLRQVAAAPLILGQGDDGLQVGFR